LREAKIRIQQRLFEKRKAAKEEISIRPPRYDEVFFAGCEWLDGLAGEGIGGLEGRLKKGQKKNLGGRDG